MFTSQDTLFGDVRNPLTQNLYIYTTNNTVMYQDPSGNEPYSYKPDKDKEVYYFESGCTLNDVTRAIYGIIPFGGKLHDGIFSLGGFDQISEDDVADAVASNISFFNDIVSLASKGESLKNIPLWLGNSLKAAGKATTVIGAILTAYDIGKAIYNSKSNEIDYVLEFILGEKLIATSNEKLIAKYTLALSEIFTLIEKGSITYETDWLGTFTSLSWKETELDYIRKMINQIEDKELAIKQIRCEWYKLWQYLFYLPKKF